MWKMQTLISGYKGQLIMKIHRVRGLDRGSGASFPDYPDQKMLPPNTAVEISWSFFFFLSETTEKKNANLTNRDQMQVNIILFHCP